MSIVQNIIGSITDNDDTSKELNINLSGSATGTTSTFQLSQTSNRVYTFSDADMTMASTSTTQTFTNKTIDGGSNTFTNIGTSSIIDGSITNVKLANSSITVTAGTGLSSGGSVSLGGSVILNNAGVLTFNAGTTGFTPSITTSGAITLGGTLNAANGGTGQTTYVVGDLLYANSTTTLGRLADSVVGNALISGGIGIAPSWGKINLGTTTTGTLNAVNGGTGQSTYIVGDILYADSTSSLGKLADAAIGNALISGGIGIAPSWGKIDLNTSVTGTLSSSSIGDGSITNVKLADMGAFTIKGNNTGVSAAPLDLTATQTTAMLNLFTSTLKGLTPASGGGTSNYLRADGTWAAPSGSGSILGEIYFEAGGGSNYVSNGIVVNVPIELTPSSTLSTSTPVSFDVPANGRLRYIGASTLIFHIACSFSCKTNFGSNQSYIFFIYKNGTVVSGGGFKTKLQNTTDYTNVVTNKLVSLATNDYISVYITNTTASNDISIYNFNIIATR